MHTAPAKQQGYRTVPIWRPGASTFPVKYGRAAIEQLLPHRPPFLLLDTITQIDVQQGCARASRRIDPEDPLLAGHFPGRPEYPEVLLLEMIAQLAQCLLAFHRAGSPSITAAAQLVQETEVAIQHASFPEPALPGDGLTMLARVFSSLGPIVVIGGQVVRDDAVCAVAVVELAPAAAEPDILPEVSST